MASKEPEDPSNNTADTDGETVALRRKRLRRVSFADREITSVHIFNRDEDYETPPNSASKPQNGEQAGEVESDNKVIRLFGDSDDSRELLCSPDNEEEGDAEDEVLNGKLFLRPKGSPSSGGSTIGSATSNDEDNFFGPVSAHFIRPGRLSDTAVSEENHDITMDSTAFSMHFRSLAMSEQGELKTPTSSHLTAEEKTPSQVYSSSDTGGAMVLTKAKELLTKSPLSADRMHGAVDSNDMSLVGENSHKYDYGRLSPTLEALLADGSNDFHATSADDNTKARSLENDLSLPSRNGTGPTDQMNKEKHGIDVTNAYQIQTSGGAARHSRFIQHESGSQHHTEHELGHDSSMDRMQNASASQIVSQPSLSPLGVSLSSANIRRQDSYLVAAGVPHSSSHVTPSPQQRGSFLTRKTLALVESLSSIQKSKSRCGLIKTSSPGSALLDRIEKSKLILSGYRSITTPSNISRQGISNSLQEKHAGVPITNLEEELSEAYDDYESEGIKDQGNVGISSPANDSNGLSTDSQSPAEAEASLLKEQEVDRVFTKSPTQKMDGSLLTEITFDCRNENEEVSQPSKFIPSPENRPNVKLPSSVDYNNLFWQVQGSKPMSNYGTEGGNLVNKCASSNSKTLIPCELDSLLVESSLLLTETSYLNGSDQPKRKHCPLNEIQNEPKQVSESHAFKKTKTPQKSHSGSSGKDLLAAKHVICSNEELPAGVIENVSSTSASPFVDSRYEPSLVKGAPSDKPIKSPSSFKRLARSPSMEMSGNEPNKEKLQLGGEDFSSLKASLNGSTDDVQSQESVIALRQTSEQDTENITGLKRKTGDIEHLVSGRGRRNPKVQKNIHVLESILDNSAENIDANKAIGVRDKLVHWTDIPRKVSAETNQLLSPLTSKLNSRLIGKLEDMLTCLKKVHLCEMLCFQIQTQKVYDGLSGVKAKRHSESRSLLCRLAYENAKLQLLHLKQKMLLKKVQAVSSGIQTFKSLRLNYVNLIHQHGEGDDQDKSGHQYTVLVNPEQGHKVTTDKGTEVTLEFKDLDSKIENLIKSIHTCYKMKGEPTYVDTIAILKDHLKQKMLCRLIRQDIQLWKVDSLNNKKGSQNVVLNYSSFINQRLTLKPGPVSNIMVSNKWNDIVIKNYFPSMDASEAFAFLFSINYSRKYVASKTLVEETQVTGSVLNNLLDVADELKLACMELQNLVQAKFISLSAGQLHLQISFINHRSCRKLIMILDMMCLTHGIYPADIIPCKLLQANATWGETSLPKSLQAEIISAVEALKVGYPRISRLCQCVSRVLQS